MRRFSASGLLAAVIACGESRPPAPPVNVARDSAGIRIVDARLPMDGEIEVWSLAENPLVVIGGDNVAAPYQFTIAVAILRLDNGRIVVHDAEDREGIRLFDSAGVFLRAFANQGGGPGEVANIGGLSRMRGDTIVVYDNWRSQLLLFDAEGRHVRSTRLERASTGGNVELPSFEFHGAFPDGTLLIDRHPGEHAGVPKGQTVEDSLRAMRVAPDGSLLTSYGPMWRWKLGWVKLSIPRRGVTTLQDGFLPLVRASLGITGSDLFYADPRDGTIRRYGQDGRLRVITRLALPPPPAGDTPSYSRDGTGRFARASGDADGNVWVMLAGRPADTTRAPIRVLVIDSTGAIRAVTRLGVPFSGVHADIFTAFAMDSLGVPFVRSVRLVKTPPR